MKTYPTTVSRTLDPTGKSLATIVGQHDHEISDADIDLVQDLQDLKRKSLLEFTTSGSITYVPFQFNSFTPNTFFIPAFDVLFNGEVVHIAGNLSADLNLNRVVLPPPSFWAPGTLAEDASVFVVFLEIWYQALDSVGGTGYFKDPQTGLFYFYPYGGVNPDPSNAEMIPNDTADPFLGINTTQRAQIQWRLNIQNVSLNYDFSKYKYGLDPDTSDTSAFGVPLATQAQAGQASPIPGTAYQFANLGPITGDSAVWRAGFPLWNATTSYAVNAIVTFGSQLFYSTAANNVGNTPSAGSPWTVATVYASSLGTMDGYSYAMPLVVVFQRNSGPFNISTNPFGSANPAISGSGLLASGVSGRFDSKLADQIFPGDVIDTRSTVKLDGWDYDKIMREGFGDLAVGNTRLAISRGLSPGNKSEALGSTLPYTVAVASSPILGTNTISSWLPLTVGNTQLSCGFTNGFGSNALIFSTAILVTTSQKAAGLIGQPWVQNDSFTISLPLNAGATLQEVSLTALVTNASTGQITPAALLQGQVEIIVGSTSASVTFNNNLTGTPFDPGTNPISVVIGVQLTAGTAINLTQIPLAVDGGLLSDFISGKQLPVFGVSDYAVQTNLLSTEVAKFLVYNPAYSNVVFGTQVWLAIAGADPRLVQSIVGGVPFTTLTLNRLGINGILNGLYVIQAWDQATNVFYAVSGRSVNGANTSVTVQGAVPATSTLMVSLLLQDTCQVAYNAPVKAITAIEETVLVGNYSSNFLFSMDPRVSIISVSYNSANSTNTILLAANGCTLQGVSGDTVTPMIWVLDNLGNLNANPISRLNIADGLMTVSVVGNNLTTATFILAAAINPALDPNSSFIVSIEYLPYQGEGVLSRNYEFVHAENNALVTTNGTGTAPVAGLSDVFPYNRELPLVVSMPSQISWNDATMTNEAVSSFFDSNFVTMRENDVEHTFLVPLHTADFIPPVNKDLRKTIQFIATGGRGFSKATPHIGYGIGGLTPETVLGQNLQATVAPISLYVNNVTGNDANNGLTQQTATLTIGAALALLPPVLRHPCVITLISTGTSFSLAALPSALQVIALGDGTIRSAEMYALGNLSRVIQSAGRLVITSQAGATSPVIIDATGFPGFGNGPTSAFYLDTTRVIFNNIQFQGFVNPTITAYNSDVDLVGCVWVNNVQAGAYVGCDSVILEGGSTTLPTSGVGHACVQSVLTSSGHTLVVAAGAVTTGPFYEGSQNSTLNLQNHAVGGVSETNITVTTLVAEVSLNSSISVSSDFQTEGTANLTANSVLARTVLVDPFLGGVTEDSTSNTVVQLG